MYKYTETCKNCKEEITLYYRQSKEGLRDSEYSIDIYVICYNCGEQVGFHLPIN